MYVARFRAFDSVAGWWYLGYYGMGTMDRLKAIHFPSAEDAIQRAALHFPGYELRAEPAK